MAKADEEKNIKNKLIEKAIEVFSLKGYEATNLTDITDALGVTRSPIYYHFKDKFGLYKAAYDLWETEFQRDYESILSRDMHILKTLESLIYCCIDSYRRFRPNFFVGIETSEELSELRDRYNMLVEKVHNSKLAMVRRAMDKGEIRKNIDPELVVDLTYAIYDGIRIGLERPIVSLKEKDIKTLVTIQLMGIERFYCD